MKNRIDLRLVAIGSATVLLAGAAGWAGVDLFRHWFPNLSAETFWDELSGLPIAAIFAIAAKSILLREKIFHLMVTVDVPGVQAVNVYLLRRRKGWNIIFMPALQREAYIAGRDTMIRNIRWWGISGIDVCTLCFNFGDSDQNGRYVRIPKASCRPYDTVQLRLSELSDRRPLTVSRQHVE